MIEKLKWDSDFFGYNVGRIILGDTNTAAKIRSFKIPDEYRLVYVVTGKLLPPEYHKYLVVRRIIFKKHLVTTNNDILITDFDQNMHSLEELTSLAYLSGTFSRYNTDKNFQNNEFRRLYFRWIQNSLNELNTRILVTTSADNLTGFITVEYVDENESKIGLISVHENYQGRRLGSKLINMAENITLESGRTILQVVTQFENKPAMILYEKNGFENIASTYIYHFWRI